MKKLIVGAAIALSCIVAGTNAHAQVHVNVNIGSPVNTAPWYGTDQSYYYLPEQGIYYNPTRRVYVFQENGNWIYNSRLPQRYQNYGWRRSHYVQVREQAPFMHHDEYANHFNRDYRGGHVEWHRGDNSQHDNGQHDRGHGRR